METLQLIRSQFTNLTHFSIYHSSRVLFYINNHMLFKLKWRPKKDLPQLKKRRHFSTVKNDRVLLFAILLELLILLPIFCLIRCLPEVLPEIHYVLNIFHLMI